MGSLSSENYHAKKKKVMVELVKGKELTIQLQSLLNKPVEDDEGSVLMEELAHKIYRSFSDTLSQIATVDCDGASASSADSKRKPGVKDRRGCHKRKRNSDSYVTISPTKEDGFAWRKYGQKNILNSEYPRCYFRCTNKHEGCKATKQVQRMKGDTVSYQTTYINHHTCKETQRAPNNLIVESHHVEPNLISFQTNIQSKQNQDSFSNPMIVSSVKHEDTQSENVSEPKSTLEDPWEDIIGLEPLRYEPEWPRYQEEVDSRFHACETTSLHGVHDMEVNDQLPDIDNFHYHFDEIFELNQIQFLVHCE